MESEQNLSSSGERPHRSWGTFWSEEGGPGEVLKLAWPLMLSTGLFSLTLFVDRMMLYWYSNEAASAAMAAGTVFWVITCVPLGTIGYTSTFVSQYMGVNREDRALHVVGQGLLLSLLVVPLLILITSNIAFLFRVFGHELNLIDLEVEYFRWLAPSGFAMGASAAMTGLFAGMGKTRVLLFSDAISTFVNLVLDAVLIFGFLAFPKMGVAGAALASTIAMYVKCFILTWLTYQFWKRSSAWKNRTRLAHQAKQWIAIWDNRLMGRLIRFGTPVGLHLLAESTSFAVIMLFVGGLGAVDMAATTLALGVNLIAFVPINGLGMAVAVLVGQRLTAGRIDLAERCVRSGLWIGGAYSLFFMVLYGIFPDFAISIYSLGSDKERFEAMRPILRPLLYFIAAYCLIDAMQIVFCSAIKGAGDTRFVLISSILIGISVVGLGAWVDALRPQGLYWWWLVITVWVFVMAIVYSARYLSGKWKTMRVIEPDLTV